MRKKWDLKQTLFQEIVNRYSRKIRSPCETKDAD